MKPFLKILACVLILLVMIVIIVAYANNDGPALPSSDPTANGDSTNDSNYTGNGGMTIVDDTGEWGELKPIG